MPELPEVETIKNALVPVIVGRKILDVITTVPTLREPLNQKELRKNIHGNVLAIRRRAKFLIFDLPGNNCLIAHLGMTGSFRVEPEKAPLLKHDRVVFLLDRNEKLIYNDIRRFGVIKNCKLSAPDKLPEEFAVFGPEPLEKNFNARYLHEILKRCKGPVKPFLMRQDIVVGVGNIYASESLFMAGISPLRPGNEITLEECKSLCDSIKRVLRDSIKQGGTTISDYRKPDGSEGKFVLRLKVYGRDGQECKKAGCKGTIEKIRQGGRSTFYCNQCQR